MNLETPIKILVRRRAALGDVIVSTGIFRELNKIYGNNAVVDVVTEYTTVFANNPYIRNVLHTDNMPNIGEYDVYYNLDDTYELNPAGHFVDNYFYRVFGTTDIDKSMELYIDTDAAQQVDKFVTAINGEFIAIHMRNWHWQLKNIRVEVWLDIVSKLHEKHPNLKIVAVGGATDLVMDLPYMIDGRGFVAPADLCYLLDHARCFVGIDSGPFHIAGASETGIVALLSHMYPDKVLPFREGVMGHRCEVVQADVSCVGCHSRQPRPVRSINCERGDFACNYMWDTDAIVAAIEKFL